MKRVPIHLAPPPADQNHVFRDRTFITKACRIDQVSYPSIHIDRVANDMADMKRRRFVNLGFKRLIGHLF
jgi:hypothetical protein